MRAFLNDGSTEFRSHPHIEALAFGHCDYDFRNLGIPSKVELKQDQEGFEVLVDGTSCFRTSDVLLPTNNYFGITATSSDTPDSFELFRFITRTSREYGREEPQRSTPPTRLEEEEESDIDLRDVLASSITSQEGRFADLHNRLQDQATAFEDIFREVQQSAERSQRMYEDLIRTLSSQDQLRALDRRVNHIETMISDFRMDFARKDYSGHFNDLQSGLKDRHDALLESLPERFGHGESKRSSIIPIFIFHVSLHLSLVRSSSSIIISPVHLSLPLSHSHLCPPTRLTSCSPSLPSPKHELVHPHHHLCSTRSGWCLHHVQKEEIGQLQEVLVKIDAKHGRSLLIVHHACGG